LPYDTSTAVIRIVYIRMFWGTMMQYDTRILVIRTVYFRMR